jgi:hypothetical protein
MDPTREEWAAKTEPARRRARFTHLKRHAIKMVEGQPRLTAEELKALAAIFADAAEAA